MKKRWEYLLSYAWLLLRIGLASALIAFWLWFDWSGDLILPFFDGAFKTDLESTWEGLHPLFSWSLKIIIGLLIWWRIVKVFAIHGSPILCGIEAGTGRMDNKGTSGRYVTTLHIGLFDVYGSNKNHIEELGFWYGAIFVSHPNSDKLARSRTEFLLLAISPQRAIVIHDSRFFLFKGRHISRAKYFRRLFDKYHESTPSGPGTEKHFRQEITRRLSEIGNTVNKIEEKGMRTFRGTVYLQNLT